MRKKLGHALIIPFGNYVKAKEDWQKEHPKATIVEEIKTLSIGIADVPNPRHFDGRTIKQEVLMIYWAIVYEDEVTGEIPATSNGKILITA